VTNSAGIVKIPLPYGIWRFCAQKAGTGGKWLTQSTSGGLVTPTGPANNTEDDPNDNTNNYRRDAARTLKLNAAQTTTQCA
jgi:hypothetical protein